MIPATKGSYVLILRLSREQRIRIGKLGMTEFKAGAYAYTGSAFGPGGLRARINHHVKRTAKPHWHIDYLRRRCAFVDVWYAEDVRMECRWAERLQSCGFASPLLGFGCSDCRCPAHLFCIEGGMYELKECLVTDKKIEPI